MTSFGYFKHKQKALEVAWQLFETQNSFWVKVNLDPRVKWKGLDKINVHRVYNLHLFYDNVGSHVCGSWSITK
jgi:hypothetical protein